MDGREALLKLGEAKRRQRGAAAQRKEFGHRKGGGRKQELYAAVPSLLVMQNLRQELLRSLGARLAEEVGLGRVFDDAAAVHDDHAVRDLDREAPPVPS